MTAEAFGVADSLLQSLLSDLETAPIESRLRPVLRYVRKLTNLPMRIVQSDIDTIYDAGWDEAAVHDAVAVCALFNFMNRYVEGLGITADPGYFKLAGDRLHRDGYAGLL